MSIQQLLFFFVVLPVLYMFLLIMLISVVCNSIKQVKQAEYAARLWYDKEKMKIGREVVEQAAARSAMKKVDLDLYSE